MRPRDALTLRRGWCRILCILLCLGPASATALIIDDFTIAQTTTVVLPVSTTTTVATGAGVLGGEREITVSRTSGVTVSATAAAGTLVHGQIAGSLGSSVLVWDGVDGGGALDPVGLGGADATDGGLSEAFSIGLLFDNVPASLTLTAYTDAGNSSQATRLLPGGIPPGPQLVLAIPFSDFTPIAGAGADFASLGALRLEIQGTSSSGLNVELGPIQTVPAPEPGTAALLGLGLIGIAMLRRGRG